MKPICKINSSFGTKEWFLNGKRHREDGPAVECASGTKAWYINGKLHRADGPAIECDGGHEVWYYRGKYINCLDNQEFLRIVKLMVFL